LLHKNHVFKWTEKCQSAFDTLKKTLTTAPILAYADMSKTFVLSCDASGYAIGYILGQIDDQNRERVISYGGRALKAEEKNWTISEKECLAVPEGIKHNSTYLSHDKFTVNTDHKALVWLHKIKDTNAKLGRWALELQRYRFDVIYREGKNNKNADAISRLSFPLTENSNQNVEDFPISVVNSIATENDIDKQKTCMTTEIRFEYEDKHSVVAALNNQKSTLDNISEVAKLQKKCLELNDMIKYLETNELPQD